MRVAVINPPFMNGRFSRTSRSPAIVKSGTMYWPFWLAYSVGMLERHGHEVLFLDCPAAGITEKKLCGVLKDFCPSMTVLDTSTPSISSDLEVARRIALEQPDSLVFLVGTHASALSEEILEGYPFLAGIAQGEYDVTIAETADAVQAEADLRSVAGLWLLDGGKPLRTPERPPIEDLDSLPLLADVYRKHLKPENYFFAAARYPSAMMITSRGCPFKCSFCVWPQVLHSGGYRARSPEAVADEFMLMQKYFPQLQEIVFEDDTFSVDSERVKAVSEALLEAGNRLPWTANTRANLSLEAMQMMKKAGCRLIIVGYESGDQEVLNRVSKGTTVEQNLQFADRARKAGLLVHGCFMAGNPGDTPETLEATYRMALNLKPDTAQFFPVMAYPGTRLYRELADAGMLTTEDYSRWLTEEGLHNCVVSLPGLSPSDLVKWCDNARKRFYLRPEYLFYKAVQSVAHPFTEGRRTLRAFATFRKYLFRRSR